MCVNVIVCYISVVFRHSAFCRNTSVYRMLNIAYAYGHCMGIARTIMQGLKTPFCVPTDELLYGQRMVMAQ